MGFIAGLMAMAGAALSKSDKSEMNESKYKGVGAFMPSTSFVNRGTGVGHSQAVKRKRLMAHNERQRRKKR